MAAVSGRDAGDDASGTGVSLVSTVYSDPVEAMGMCAINSLEYSSSVAGWGLVRVTGLEYPKREHWASLFPLSEDLSDAMVRDGTIRQFSTDVPALWKGSLDEWLDLMTELLVDGLAYECYRDTRNPVPFFTDHWIREDVEPGSMTRPWGGGVDHGEG